MLDVILNEFESEYSGRGQRDGSSTHEETGLIFTNRI